MATSWLRQATTARSSSGGNSHRNGRGSSTSSYTRRLSTPCLGRHMRRAACLLAPHPMVTFRYWSSRTTAGPTWPFLRTVWVSTRFRGHPLQRQAVSSPRHPLDLQHSASAVSLRVAATTCSRSGRGMLPHKATHKRAKLLAATQIGFGT